MSAVAAVVVVVAACDVDELPTQILDCQLKLLEYPAQCHCCALFEREP